MRPKTRVLEDRWHKGSDIIQTFAVELQEFSQTGAIPAHAGQDVAWSLEQQKKRLDALDLDLDYQFNPRGHFGQGQGTAPTWTDGHYISRMGYRSCRFRRTISRKGRRLHKQDRNILLYQTVTDVHDYLAARSHTHTCPNCGGFGTLGSLVDGCDYCGTRFKMTDLYPRITGFYYLDDYGRKPEEMKREIARYMIPSMISLALLTILCSIGTGAHPILVILYALFMGGIFGGLFGYLLWAFRILAKLFKDAGRAIAVLLHIGNSQSRFVNAMKRYSPEFSYAYFSDAVVNLLKTVLYSDDPQNLPIFEGNRLSAGLSRIVDAVQFGGVALKRFRVTDGICHITADVHMDTLCLVGRHIRKRNMVFRLKLRRDVSKPVDLHFSIHALQCKNCAASFDALRHKHCPSCGSAYGTEDLEWIITDLKKR